MYLSNKLGVLWTSHQKLNRPGQACKDLWYPTYHLNSALSEDKLTSSPNFTPPSTPKLCVITGKRGKPETSEQCGPGIEDKGAS
jgi:hypothetical protein